MSGRLTYGPLVEQDLPGGDRASGQILDIFTRNASWIWTPEPGLDAPQAPGDEQRAFRAILTPSSGKVHMSATILVTANNYFALYVNGIRVHAADPEEDWAAPRAFTVALPRESERVVVAIRALNRIGDDGEARVTPAGMRAAVKLNYDDNTSMMVFTGQDRAWKGRKLFDEGWEQPDYDDRNWEAAAPWAAEHQGTWGNMGVVERVLVASAVPSGTSGPVSTPVNSGGAAATVTVTQTLGASGLPGETGASAQGAISGGQGRGADGVLLSEGAFAGLLVAAILVSAVLGSVLTYFFLHRRHKRSHY